ncbi:hypothetical protein KOW79_004000 [Hemibagrus wyckioides]|uniref:SUEL-type lectin domain-containing protein n=2 Tax=Hemibagrus wyckioides TaxID=337641 RepID=A0A9D3SPB3_9TELE|nr:hypothetical protein KOW79_004000 [Hemibagrus wyckioides]
MLLGDRKIEIISASYGRTETIVCSTGRPLEQLANTNCNTPEALNIVKDRSDGESSCHVPAENSVFSEACPGTFNFTLTLGDGVLSSHMRTVELESAQHVFSRIFCIVTVLFSARAPFGGAHEPQSLCDRDVSGPEGGSQTAMSLFTKIFGSGGKGEKAPSPQDAIQKLRETEEMLSKKQEFLEKKIEAELLTAKKNGTKNKRAALQALKRKKRYEKQLAQIDGTLSTIEYQREALENANTNTEVLKNMGFAAKAMKNAHQNMDIDKVDELMQDITEQQELAQEISDAISKPVAFGDEFDEDELLAELEELEQEELDNTLLEIGGQQNVSLPSVPSTSLPSQPAKSRKEEDDDDMEELKAWAM